MSQIIKAITSDILSDDYEQNLNYILFLINANTNDSDSLKKGKSNLYMILWVVYKTNSTNIFQRS